MYLITDWLSTWTLNLLPSNLLSPNRKLKEVHKRLNELRELVQYYEQTSDMMVDAVNENVKEVEEDDEEEDDDGSMFETAFELDHENRQPGTNLRWVWPKRYKYMKPLSEQSHHVGMSVSAETHSAAVTGRT